MEYLLGLDVGTSGVKALLITVEGEIAGSDTQSYPLSTPRSGWAEQNPNDWWQATKKAITNVIEKSGVQKGELQGISLSGQMHSSVFLDKNREVIRPAILWSDTRTSSQCEEIYERAGGLKELIKYVSNPALEGFTAPKVLWLRENEPQNFQKIKHLMLPKDYIRFKLTGEIKTEVSDAAGTLFFDVKSKKWSRGLLEKLEIDPEILPEVLNSVDIAGQITSEVAEETGLETGIPVAAGGADNACGAAGSGIVKEGRVMASIGTSGVILAQSNTPAADMQGRIHLFNHSRPDCWYMMGVVLSAGMCYSWLQENVYEQMVDFAELDDKASGVAPGSDGLIFLPYLYGERTPHADGDARGVFFGLSGQHKQAHFARSVMEGVGFALRDSLELIKDKGIEIEEIRTIGGGAKSPVWRSILADVFGEEISLLNIEEGPAFGAAVIAGVGVGVFDSFEQAEENLIKVEKRIAPDSENVKKYNQYYKLYRDLYPSLKENYNKLSALTDTELD
ncbi:MAG: xylulokinase [Halanaerobiaceae bacterium]